MTDVLKFILELMFHNNTAIFDHLFVIGGLEIFVNILIISDEQVRILALESIGRFLKVHAKMRAKVQNDSIFGFLEVTRILSAFTFTKATYKALRDILLCEVSYSQEGSFKTTYELMEENSHEFEIPGVLPVIFKLLLSADIGIRQLVAQDFILLLKSR